MAWRKAGRSLKGFGFVTQDTACALTLGFSVGRVRVAFVDRLGLVPQATACALTVGFSVGKVRVPFIHRLGFVPEGMWPGGRPVVP